MSNFRIVVLVLFAVVVLLWALVLLDAFAFGRASGWLPFAACLLLGVGLWQGEGRA